MLPRKPRHHLYAVLLLAISVVSTSGLANTRIYELITEIGSALAANVSSKSSISFPESITFSKINSIGTGKNSEGSTALLFMTIVQGADEEVTCANDGSTVARFNLCGNFDNRLISLSGGTGEWQRLVPTGACTFDTSNDCPANGTNCNTSWQAAGTSATFNLVANTVPAATGGEYRVRVAGGPWFYFKVTKSTILQNFIKTDFICGRPGQIQIVGLNSSYEYSINGGSGFGPWQGPIFNNLLPGTYNVLARQQGTPDACEYPYAPITILQQDISIDVTFVDALCSGDTGSISVTANNVPGPYRYTLLNAAGIPQEFTAFLSSNTHTFSAVGFGTYIVQVETQQCTGDPLNGIDPPRQALDIGGNPIVIGNGLAALDASTQVNSSFGCSTIGSVDITVITSGGQAPYSFTVNGGPSQPSYTGSTTFTVTSGGTYDFFITDANGCTIMASSNVETLSPPNVTATGVNGTCSNGGARINFNVVNASGYNLSYRVNGTDLWDTNPSISVAAGTYNNLEVLYQQGTFQCTLTLPPVTVTAVGVINGSATKIADRTCNGSGGVNGGQIDFGPASGGSGSGYVFSIDGLNFSAVTSYANLVPGTYTPIVQDGGGCRLELTPIVILDVDPPTDITFVQSNSNCTANTSDVQLTGTSSAAITNYSIVSPITLNNGTNATFVGLSTTTSYIFRITDANNCTYTEGFTPSILSSIRARVRSGGDTQVCNGASDGSGTFLIDGFTNNYTYNINGGTESAPQNVGEVNLTGLNAGTYTITITDADTGCTDTASFTVNEAPVLTLGGNITPMSCANNNLGRVVATTTGGWGNNRYTLIYPGGGTTVGPRTSATFGNLSVAGTYTLNVEDAEGCTATFAFDLTPIAAPTISLDAPASDFCFVPGIGASITVSSTAGTAAIGSHQYRINGGALQASPVFAGLSPGNYTIQVVDGNNCSDDVNVTVNPQLRVNTSIETEIPCGGADGQVRVQVLGGYTSGAGTKQYEVSLNGGPFGGATPLTSNNFLYSTNVPGDYIFRITDNEGCTADSNPLTLNPPASIAAPAVSTTAVSCGNTSNGTVTIIPNATVGIAPYEVSFNGGAFTSQTIYSNLAVGTYPYTVRDARGCIATGTVDVLLDTTPTPETTVSEIQANCSVGNIVAGGIQIDNVTDGNENFSFIVEDIFGNQIVRVDNIARAALPFAITNPALVPGNYRVITLDANGCNDIDTVTITTPDVVITPIPPTPPTTCDDSAFTYTVQVTPTIFPVTPTYQIRIQGQPAFYALNNIGGNDFHQFSNATDGIQYGVAYTVEVLAPNGCIYEQEIPPIDGFSDMDITATSGGAFCDNSGNGRTDFTVIDFLGPDLFIELIEAGTGTVIGTDSPTGLTGGLGSSYSGFFNVQPGAYTIRVTDSDTCTDATTIDVVIDAPRVDVLSNISANCNALGQLTYIGSGGNPFSSGSPYLYAVVPQGNPVTFISPTDTTDDFSEETTRVLPGSVAGIVYDVWVIDSRGCTFNVSQEIIQLQPDLGSPTFIVDNQCDVTSTSFDIVVSVPGSLNTPRFTLGGDEQFGVLNGVTGNYEYTYTVSTTGSYVVDVVDANGCTGQGIAIVYDFLSASGSFTTQSTCNAADGEITIVPVGGSGDFEYVLTGTDYLGGAVTVNQTNNAIFTGMSPGNYQVLVTDNLVTDGVANCNFLVNNIVLDAATLPVITPTTPQDVTCNGQNDGSIDIILQAGTDVDGPMTYRLLNFDTRAMLVSNNAGAFPNLVPGRYEVEVVSIRNCTALSGLLEISEPPVFAIGATAADFACEPGANRFSSTILTATITSPGTPTNYRYSITGFENYQTSPTFEIVDNGSVQNITVYAIDSNGCEATASVTINPPMDVIPSIVQIDPLNCRDPERVRIQVVGTGDFTVTTLSAIAVAPVTNTPGNDYVDVFLPDVGDYFFEVQDNEPLGCVYPMPMHTVISPVLPTVTIGEAGPVQCFGASDGALSIEVTDYTGQYTYNVFSGSDPLKTTPLATGTLDTANNPEIITGLPGGNFFVEVVAIGSPFCSADSNIATIRTPNGPLVATAVEVGNVSCNNNAGIIEALASGGWDTSPYVYGLLRSTDGGATYTVAEIAASNPNEFENLQAGFYQVQVSDVEGCTATFDIELQEVPQIDAGIREPQGLVCPNGNNAVLEAFDPTSGTAITATAGATGGFPGAGYNYRLLYLNSNDNTDIASSSGLQNTPTFVGASGGFISGGWYAIEVSSSFDCVFVTTPYFVNPPPPIQPRLVQTNVPGCGGDGEMRLFIENHDPLSTFEYEYRRIPTPDPINDPYTDFGPGVTSILISAPGSPAGINYQYEVRKKNAANTCLAVNSNGVTMTDAVGITLLPNSPVNDISCASELDGRIESFIVGGVGNEMYTLYIGQPTDGFNPGAATVFRGPQNFGTFEGVPEGTDYWIGVTSGATCEDIDGPFTVVRPEPILYNASSTPVLCNGDANGTITLEVSSGGVGLIQFAIAPNFNEFFSDPANPGNYTFDDLLAGSYEVLIQDENGCFERAVVAVGEPAVLSATLANTTPETCIGFEDGSAQLTVTGGTPFVDPLTFATYFETRLIGPNSDGSEVFLRNDNLYFDNLAGGQSYIIEIRDVNNCLTDLVAPIMIGVDLSAEPLIQYGCNGIFPFSTTTITMQDTSLLPDLMFALDPLDPTDAISANAGTDFTWGNLSAGNHTVYIYHLNGCTNSVDFIMEAYDPLTLDAVKTGPNEITATAEGGFGNYEFFFQGESFGTENSYTTNESTLVTVEVRDEGGCVAVVTIPFEFTGMLEIPNFFTPDGDNNNDVWYPRNREFFPYIDVKIYDRYGRVVAELNQVTSWDGTYDGNALPSGDYWYVVNANDKSKIRYVGHFTLYR